MTISAYSPKVGTPLTHRGHPGRKQGASENQVAPLPAHLNYIPEPESLMTMIRSAVSALKRGMVWDRGSILNILA